MALLIPLLSMLGCFILESTASSRVTQSPVTKTVNLGDTVSLSCTASYGVDNDLSWYLQKPAQPPKLLFYKITSRMSDTPGHYSSTGYEPDFTLTITGVQTDDVGHYYCMGYYRGPEITFGGGTELILSSTDPMVRASVSLLPPSPEELSGGSATVVCLLSGYSPQGAVVTWEVDGSEVTEGVVTSVEEKKNGLYSRSSTLNLTREQWEQRDRYTCRVSHQGLTQDKTIHRGQCRG